MISLVARTYRAVLKWYPKTPNPLMCWRKRLVLQDFGKFEVRAAFFACRSGLGPVRPRDVTGHTPLLSLGFSPSLFGSPAGQGEARDRGVESLQRREPGPLAWQHPHCQQKGRPPIEFSESCTVSAAISAVVLIDIGLFELFGRLFQNSILYTNPTPNAVDTAKFIAFHWGFRTSPSFPFNALIRENGRVFGPTKKILCA